MLIAAAEDVADEFLPSQVSVLVAIQTGVFLGRMYPQHLLFYHTVFSIMCSEGSRSLSASD